MPADGLFWSAFATAQYLEADISVRNQINDCVDLIQKFPFIGVKMASEGLENRRRFVCAGYVIVYLIRETRLMEIRTGESEADPEEAPVRMEVTIMRFKRT